MKHLVFIETVKGSGEKYKYEPHAMHLKLKKSLPLGMVFPYDFGFLPGTKGEDGDPLDAVVISEMKSFPGLHIECRLIGALLAIQTEKRKKVRNDRFYFVPTESVVYQYIKSIRQFPARHNDQLRDFYINYNKAEDKIFTPIRLIEADKAEKLIQQSML